MKKQRKFKRNQREQRPVPPGGYGPLGEGLSKEETAEHAVDERERLTVALEALLDPADDGPLIAIEEHAATLAIRAGFIWMVLSGAADRLKKESAVKLKEGKAKGKVGHVAMLLEDLQEEQNALIQEMGQKVESAFKGGADFLKAFNNPNPSAN